MAVSIRCRIDVDDKACALLTIENALTGTDECPTYRVALDRFRERDTIVAEVKNYARAGKTRLDLVAEAFRVIAEQERA